MHGHGHSEAEQGTAASLHPPLPQQEHAAGSHNNSAGLAWLRLRDRDFPDLGFRS